MLFTLIRTIFDQHRAETSGLPNIRLGDGGFNVEHSDAVVYYFLMYIEISQRIKKNAIDGIIAPTGVKQELCFDPGMTVVESDGLVPCFRS